MPEVIIINGVTMVVKATKAVDHGLFVNILIELIGPFGIKYIEISATKDGLLEPEGPSA
jgi:hypothetical protein